MLLHDFSSVACNKTVHHYCVPIEMTMAQPFELRVRRIVQLT
jgi:hypothetical protein